jgi:hypothetical protein
MTLSRVEVSSKNIFEKGQFYVALSRATSLDGLILTGDTEEQLKPDAEVLEFYKNTKWEDSPEAVEDASGSAIEPETSIVKLENQETRTSESFKQENTASSESGPGWFVDMEPAPLRTSYNISTGRHT